MNFGYGLSQRVHCCPQSFAFSSVIYPAQSNVGQEHVPTHALPHACANCSLPPPVTAAVTPVVGCGHQTGDRLAGGPGPLGGHRDSDQAGLWCCFVPVPLLCGGWQEQQH